MLRGFLIFFVCILVATAALAQTEEPPTPVIVEMRAQQPLAADERAAMSAELAGAQADRAASSAEAAIASVNTFSSLTQTLFTVVAILIPTLSAAVIFFVRQYVKRIQQEIEVARLNFQKTLSDLENEKTKYSRSKQALPIIELGGSQYRSGDIDGAITTYLTALGTDPDNPQILYKLGYIYTQRGEAALGDYDEALNHLENALRLDMHYAPALATLGYAHRRKGERFPVGDRTRDELFEKAERQLREALRQLPKLVDEEGESWYGALGGLYRRLGNFTNAIRAYEMATEVTPFSSYPFSNLALLHLQSGSRDKALDCYEKAEFIGSAETQARLNNYWGHADLLISRLALGRDKALVDAALRMFVQTVPFAKADAFDLLNSSLKTLANFLEKSPADQDKVPEIRNTILILENARDERIKQRQSPPIA